MDAPFAVSLQIQHLHCTFARRMAGSGQQWQKVVGVALTLKGSAVQLITPVSCGVMDGYVQATNRIPKYMFVPKFCDVEVVQ